MLCDFRQALFLHLHGMHIVFKNFTFIELWNYLQWLPPMDIAVWALVAFILLVVVRRNIGFFEIPSSTSV
jgi:disulfide bond formation protein DsbB